MSARAVSINDRQLSPEKRHELEQVRRRKSWKDDALYLAGALLVTAGLAMIRIQFALLVAGGFCLLFPLLELATGFIRGLRAPQGPRR
jgi:hypothetical protein